MEVSGHGDAVSFGSPLESVDRRFPDAEPATPRGCCWHRALLPAHVETDRFLRAAGEDAAAAEDGGAPAFAVEHFGAGHFLVGVGFRLKEDQLAGIGDGQHFVPREDDLAGAKARLLPLHGAVLDVHSLDRAFAIFLVK